MQIHHLCTGIHRGQSVIEMRLRQFRNAPSVSTNAQETISNENETLSMQKCNALAVSRNVQGTISDGNETQLM